MNLTSKNTEISPHEKQPNNNIIQLIVKYLTKYLVKHYAKISRKTKMMLQVKSRIECYMNLFV